MTDSAKIRFATSPWVKTLLICAGFTALYLLIAGSSTLWDRDEPRYARVTAEMVESGNYLVPTFNGQIWFDKPILLYWLMSVPVRLLGPSEIACRFAGVMGTAVTLLLTFFIGKKLFDAKAGLWAEAILGTTLLMLFVGSSALVDGITLPFIVGAMAIFVSRLGEKIRAIDAGAMGVLIGLGMLAKGPLGLLPVFVIIVAIWFGRENTGGFIRNFLWVCLAVVIAAGIFLLWAIPANRAADGELYRVFFGKHIVGRALSPMEGHGGNFLLYLPYYPAIMVAGFFPWVIFLPGAFSASLGKRIGNAGARNILLSWIIVTVVLMTIAATKLPHYILFAWPAMAVMTGATIVASGQNILSEHDRKWLRGGVWFLGPVGLGIAASLIGIGYFTKSEGLITPGLICGAIALAMTITCCYLQVREKFDGTAKIILAGVLILIIPLLFVLLPAVESIKISPHIAKAIREKTSKDVPVAMYKYAEPTLNFYVGRKITQLRKTEDVVDWLKGTETRVLIIPRNDFESIRQNAGDIAFEEIASKKGINYSKGKEVEVIALLVKTQTRQ
ncbi:MAG: glycosyltransferase family 39 protein [Sedimentisphaerales bacterium]|jgi:4-amino-4-deoxy-L-arabinose transferase-like glycosyltransferase